MSGKKRGQSGKDARGKESLPQASGKNRHRKRVRNSLRPDDVLLLAVIVIILVYSAAALVLFASVKSPLRRSDPAPLRRGQLPFSAQADLEDLPGFDAARY